ncbi:MAG: DUF364 domain-containing protein [Candidatus Riflebacteria bacterium]
MKIAQALIDFALPLAEKATVKDLRLGLGYSCIELSDGRSGVAWTPDKRQSGSCTHLRQAGNLLGLNASETLSWLDSENLLERAAGLATFNALNSRVKRELCSEEATSLLQIKNSDHVVMVGYFAPIIPKLKETGCRLEIVELDEEKPEVLNTQQGFKALAECDVAIITATSIINNTADDLFTALKRNRAATILGPSTPMAPEAFKGTRITQLSGSFVRDIEKVKTIISQGGGTMLMKKFLDFATVKI